MQEIDLREFKIGPNHPLCVISGPCVIESEDHCLKMAETLKAMMEKLEVNFVFKASYDKANRSSIDSFRGPGPEKGLKILQKVKKELNLLVTSDIHLPEQVPMAAEVLDILQIPAFLARQTDLLIAAAQTMKPVNVKKGQFMAPWDMQMVINKITSTGNHNLILTERGASFGYNNLVSDMRSIAIMQDMGYPVCYDASHSVQLPGGQGSCSGGNRQFIPTLARAAIAAKANCLFIESHPDPDKAKSDAATVYPFDQLPTLLQELQQLYQLVQAF